MQRQILEDDLIAVGQYWLYTVLQLSSTALPYNMSITSPRCQSRIDATWPKDIFRVLGCYKRSADEPYRSGHTLSGCAGIGISHLTKVPLSTRVSANVSSSTLLIDLIL